MILAVGSAMIGLFYLNDSLRGDSPSDARIVLSLAIKASLALSFPLLLFAFRFFDEREMRRIGEIWQKMLLLIKNRRLKAA